MIAPEQKVSNPSPVVGVQNCKDYFYDAVIMVIQAGEVRDWTRE